MNNNFNDSTLHLQQPCMSPVDFKEMTSVNPNGNHCWIFIGRANAETKASPNVKTWLTRKDPDAGKDWRREEKRMTEDEMAGWPHWLDGCESEWTRGVGDGQGGLVCCDSWGRRVGHDWETELNWTDGSKMDNLEEMDRFLENFNLSRLKHEKIQIMNNPITSTEIEAVIKNLSQNKNLGPDGFTGEFCETFREELMLILLKLFQKIAE